MATNFIAPTIGKKDLEEQSAREKAQFEADLKAIENRK